MAFQDYVARSKTLSGAIDAYVGNNTHPVYRKAVADMFVGSALVALGVVAFAFLLKVPGIAMLGLYVFTGWYCGRSIKFFRTGEGRVFCDARMADPDTAPAFLVRYWTPLLVAVIVGTVTVLLLPTFFLSYWTGLLISSFLLVGSPAVIWWKQREQL